MKLVPLSEIAMINPRGENIRSGETISFVGMADLDAATARTSRGTSRSFGEVSTGYTIFHDGDILAAKITPCWENGKVGQAKLGHRLGVGSTEFHVIRPKDVVHDRYLIHFLRQDHVRATGALRMTGSGGQRRVPGSFFQALEVPLPPLPEQRRIAAILDHADALRTKRRQVLARLDALTQSIFQEMFGSPDDAFAVQPLGEVTGLVGGRNLVATDLTQHVPYRVLRISAVTTGVFKATESKPLPSDYAPPEHHLVRRGDLLMSRANTSELVGAVAHVVQEPPANLALPDKIWRFSWKQEADSRFFHALLNTPTMRRRIGRLASGTGGSMKNIPKAKLEQLLIPRVPLSEQRQFSRRAEAVQRARGQHEQAAEIDAHLFASLQSRAFQGEL
ncbi:restriction endonuclease subunit S [Mariniluteicoccus flavus]